MHCDQNYVPCIVKKSSHGHDCSNNMEGQALYMVICSCLMILSATAFGAHQIGEGQSCGDKEVFLTSNSTLAPLGMISASGSSSGYPATNLYNFGHIRDGYFKTWCTVDFDSPNPYIEMELTSPVLITQILTSGRSTPSQFYFVTNFTIEYSLPNDTTNLVYYNTETGSIQYFTAHQLITLTSLESPLLTKRLRVRPLQWFDMDGTPSFDYICLGIGLYGCLATEGVPIVISTDLENSAQPTSATLNENGGTAAQSVTMVVRDYQTVAIVLPIALLTIIINAAIVAVGVFLCMFLKGQKKEERGSTMTHTYENFETSSKTLERSQKQLEDDPINSERLAIPRTSIGVIKKVDNPIYGSNFVPAQLDMPDTSAHEHLYSSASEIGYEPVDHTAHSKDTEDDDLLDNLAYGSVDIQPESVDHQFHGTDNLAYDSVDIQPESVDHQFHLDLKDNACYNSVSSTPIPDEGEYSYPATLFEPVQTSDNNIYLNSQSST